MFAGVLIYYHWEAMLVSYLSTRFTILPFKDINGLMMTDYKIGVKVGANQQDYFRLSKDPLLQKAYKERIEPNLDQYPASYDEFIVALLKDESLALYGPRTEVRWVHGVTISLELGKSNIIVLFQLYPKLQKVRNYWNSCKVWYQSCLLRVPKTLALSRNIWLLSTRNERERSFETDLQQVWEGSPNLSRSEWKSLRFWKLFYGFPISTFWLVSQLYHYFFLPDNWYVILSFIGMALGISIFFLENLMKFMYKFGHFKPPEFCKWMSKGHSNINE